MERKLQWYVHDRDGLLVGATVTPEDAAALLAALVMPGTIRDGQGRVLYVDGKDGDAARSYDAVAAIVYASAAEIERERRQEWTRLGGTARDLLAAMADSDNGQAMVRVVPLPGVLCTPRGTSLHTLVAAGLVRWVNAAWIEITPEGRTAVGLWRQAGLDKRWGV